MPDGIRWVGLDVHAHESTIAIFDQATGEVTTKRVVGRPHELLPYLRAVPRPARMVYEAGPTGYGLARRARADGIEIVVCAPGRTDRAPGDRLKTDKRDAIRLARALAAGQLAIVTVPSIEREQLRDLVRCREDIRSDLMRARHRLGKFLLRREIYYEGPGEPWSRKHRAWLTSLRFADRASQLTIADYLHSHDVLIARRDRVEDELATLAAESRCKDTVAARFFELRVGKPRRHERLTTTIGTKPVEMPHVLQITPASHPSSLGSSPRRLGHYSARRTMITTHRPDERMSTPEQTRRSAKVGRHTLKHLARQRITVAWPAHPSRRPATLPTICPL